MAAIARMAAIGRGASRRFTPALVQGVHCRTAKTSTGIVGLEPEANAKPILLDLYAKTLAALEGMPAEAEYRKTVEGMTKERINVLNSTDDLTKVEASIGGGQVEQLIQQAEDELSLIPKLIAARAFDPYDGNPPEEILSDLKRCGHATPSQCPCLPCPTPSMR